MFRPFGFIAPNDVLYIILVSNLLKSFTDESYWGKALCGLRLDIYVLLLILDWYLYWWTTSPQCYHQPFSRHSHRLLGMIHYWNLNQCEIYSCLWRGGNLYVIYFVSDYNTICGEVCKSYVIKHVIDLYKDDSFQGLLWFPWSMNLLTWYRWNNYFLI
jgi:hypothetical protein